MRYFKYQLSKSLIKRSPPPSLKYPPADSSLPISNSKESYKSPSPVIIVQFKTSAKGSLKRKAARWSGNGMSSTTSCRHRTISASRQAAGSAASARAVARPTSNSKPQPILLLLFKSYSRMPEQDLNPHPSPLTPQPSPLNPQPSTLRSGERQQRKTNELVERHYRAALYAGISDVPPPILQVGGADRLEKLEMTETITRAESAERRASASDAQVRAEQDDRFCS